MKRALFVHRSVGQHVLNRTQLRMDLFERGVYLVDVNANNLIVNDGWNKGERTSIPMRRQGTDPEDIAELFRRATEDHMVETELNEFDALILKSCYTIWNASVETIRTYITAYENFLLPYMLTHPQQIFIIATPPPPRRRQDAEKRAETARFVSAIRSLGRELPNVRTWDIYRTLSDGSGRLSVRYRSRLPWDQHPNPSGSIRIARELIQSLEQAWTP